MLTTIQTERGGVYLEILNWPIGKDGCSNSVKFRPLILSCLHSVIVFVISVLSYLYSVSSCLHPVLFMFRQLIYIHFHLICIQSDHICIQSTYVNSEAVFRRCIVKKVFLESSQNSQESTCARESFSINLQAWGLQLGPAKWRNTVSEELRFTTSHLES